MVGMHNFLINNINKDIAKLLPYKGRVLDLGCGTTPYKTDILRVADEYIGVDWGHSLHDDSNVDVIADLTKGLPFGDNDADTIVSFQVLEHLPEPDYFLSECYRVLRNGGTLFLTVPFMWHVHEQPYDYFRYTRYGLQYLLEKNQFTYVEVKENTGFWQMWTLKFNYHTTRFAKGPLKFFWVPIWWFGQTITPILDKYDKNLNETASYSITAKK
jgi:SAM-dependent methyltransferase